MKAATDTGDSRGEPPDKQQTKLLVKEARHKDFIIESYLHEVSRKGSCRCETDQGDHLAAGAVARTAYGHQEKGTF